jgi:hypothetical protein
MRGEMVWPRSKNTVIGILLLFLGTSGMIPSVQATTVTKPWAVPLLKINEGKGNCPQGYVCFWYHENFGGSGVAVYGTETNWAGWPEGFREINDNASSVFNNGFSNDKKPDVTFSRDANGGGGTFLLCSGESVALLPYDIKGNWANGKFYDKSWGDVVSSNFWIVSHPHCR